jgi:ribosome-associated heat shock protein Hsp15
MRIDVLLKQLCLLKSRSAAKALCEKRAILINDKPVKPSSTVKAGDRITIHYSHRTLTLNVTDLPDKQLSRSAAPTYYKVIRELDSRDEGFA